MIIKRIKTGKKSTLKRLLDYITQPERADGTEKCTESQALGDFLTDDRETQKTEMIATAYEAKKSPNPAEHFVLSWRPEENPTPQQIREAVKILTDEIKCTGHQVLYGIHKDKDHIHAHAIINRAKDGERVIPACFLTDKQHRAIALICDLQKWPPTPNQVYRIEGGQLIKNERTPNENGQSISHGASRAEISNGQKSAERIAQKITPQAIKQAKNWREFHQILAREGLSYQTKGSGAVIQVYTTAGSQIIKASTAHKQASLNHLQNKFGAFEPSTAEITPRAIEPIQTADPEQVREYNSRKDEQRKKQEQQREELRNRHGEEWQELKTQQAQERAEAITRQNWTNRGQELNRLRQAIAQQQRQEREQLKARQAQERKQITQPNRQTFTEYNKQQQQSQRIKLPKPHKENDTASKILKIAGAGLIKATAQAVNPFADLLKPARQQLERDEEDEQERNERGQLYEHYNYR